VAAVAEQDLVQVVALLVAVEDRLDARVELGRPVPDRVGGGGSLADAVDRRTILLGAQSLTLLCSAGLAVNADTGPALWPLFALPAMAAGFATATESGLSAMLPNLARRSEVAAVNAMFQALFQIGQVAGPAVAGLLLAGAGVRFVYWMDVATMAAAIAVTFLMGPQVPQGGAGLPRAVFPALALTVFGGGAQTLGFLYAAPGAGALLGAVTAGWIPRIRRQGRAVIAAVLVWGAAIACFGLVPCPPHSRCWPWPAAPTSSRRCSAARSFSSACPTICAAG
jgi:MFS family permease